MIDTMQELRNNFQNRTTDEKLVMAYLASGNSAYDILSMLVEYMQVSKDGWAEYVESVRQECKEADEDDGDVQGEKTSEAMYLDIYEQLGESINTPLIG